MNNSSLQPLALFRCKACRGVLGLTDGTCLVVGSAVLTRTTALGCWCGTQTTWRQPPRPDAGPGLGRPASPAAREPSLAPGPPPGVSG